VGKAKVLKIPYILVVGDDDVAAGTVGCQSTGHQPARAGGGDHRVHQILESEMAERRLPEPR